MKIDQLIKIHENKYVYYIDQDWNEIISNKLIKQKIIIKKL